MIQKGCLYLYLLLLKTDNVNLTVKKKNKLYEMELSIICDQRYGEKDMERILHGIEDAM